LHAPGIYVEYLINNKVWFGVHVCIGWEK